jgi:prepilin-type N-terminal cleavage/methylation domain-containing protein
MRRLVPQQHKGFSLVELLIVLALGGTILGVAGTVLLQNIRSSISLERNQQALNELGPIAAFIELEVGEAGVTSAGNAIRRGVANPCNASGAQEAFTLSLPLTSQLIQYYTTGSDREAVLWRCGPLIENTGRLNLNARPTAFPLGFQLAISNVTVDARGQSVTYTLASTNPDVSSARTLTPTVRIRSNQVTP